MQRAISVTGVIVLILAGIGLKVMLTPTGTIAGTHEMGDAVSIYDLHLNHPGMAEMPVQNAPLP